MLEAQRLSRPEKRWHQTAIADLPILREERRVYSAGAVASVLACETQNVGRQGVFIIPRLWDIVHGIMGNTQRVADRPFGVAQTFPSIALPDPT
jgi:hypothetical protein